jgi:hypothetical protein
MRYRLPERASQRQKSGQHGGKAPLQPSRCADADQLSHQQPEIEASGVNQQPLPNVGVAAEVHATHPTGLVEMGKRPFQSLTPESQQAQAPRAADAPTIAAHGVAGLRILFQFRRPRSGSEM